MTEEGLAVYLDAMRIKKFRWGMRGMKCDHCGDYSWHYNLIQDTDGKLKVLCYKCQYSYFGREIALALAGKCDCFSTE